MIMCRIALSGAFFATLALLLLSKRMVAADPVVVQPLQQSVESVGVKSQRDNKELLEQLKKEQFELATAGDGLLASSEEMIGSKSDDVVRIADYADTVRSGGLEGSVGGGAKYDTPNKLQDEIHTVNSVISAAISQFSPSLSFPQLLTQFKTAAIPPQRLQMLKRKVPFVQYVAELLNQSCPQAQALSVLEMTGDSSEERSFPTCLIKAAAGLDRSSKQDMGLRIRAALADPAQVADLFEPKVGVCPIIQSMLNLPAVFCEELRDLFYSVTQFLKLSDYVQKEEQKVFGDEAAMLQLESTAVEQPIQPHALRGIDAQRAALRGRLLFRQMWNSFSLAPLKIEAQHLVDVWYNDPIHKWRYSIGIFQFFVILGYWLSEAAAAATAATTV